MLSHKMCIVRQNFVCHYREVKEPIAKIIFGSDKDEEVLKEIKERDDQDMNREIAPLKQADDAVLVDTTELTLPESIDYMIKVIKERL